MDIINDFKSTNHFQGDNLYRALMENKVYSKRIIHQRYVNVKVYNHILEKLRSLEIQLDLIDPVIKSKEQIINDIESLKKVIKLVKEEQQLIGDVLQYHKDKKIYNIFQ